MPPESARHPPHSKLTVAACRWRHAAGRRLWPDHRLIAIPGCTDIYGSCPSRSATYFEAHIKFRAPPGRFFIGTCIVGRRWSTSCYGCLAAPTPAGGYNITHDKCSGTSSASKRRATCPCWCSEAASTTCEAHAGCSHPLPQHFVVRRTTLGLKCLVCCTRIEDVPPRSQAVGLAVGVAGGVCRCFCGLACITMYDRNPL